MKLNEFLLVLPTIQNTHVYPVPGENHRPAASHWQTLSHHVYRVHLAWVAFELAMLVVIGSPTITKQRQVDRHWFSDCILIASCKFKIHDGLYTSTSTI